MIDSGLVSNAAEEVGITQPAVSKIVKGREQEFGVRLFERRKGMAEYGKAYLNNPAAIRPAQGVRSSANHSGGTLGGSPEINCAVRRAEPQAIVQPSAP